MKTSTVYADSTPNEKIAAPIESNIIPIPMLINA